MILKIGKTGGKMRVHGDTDGERGGAEPGPDAGRGRGKRVDAFCRRVEEGDLCVGTARVGAGGVCATRPAGAGGGAGLSVQDDRQVDAADHAAHPAVPADGGGAGGSLSAAALRAGVHGGGRAAAGAGGPGTRAAERAGDASHSGAGIRSIRAGGICAAGRDFGSASLQSAKETGLSESGGGQTRKGTPDIYGWIPCIRGTGKAARECTISTPWTRSRNGKWWGVRRKSAKRI